MNKQTLKEFDMNQRVPSGQKIFLDDPCMGEEEKKYLCDAVDSGFVSSVGPFIPEFEKKMAAYLGVPKAVALQSGTAAIYLALREAGIGPGDEVIVPSLTFAATVNPVLYLGATPVIVDVDKHTWNIDPEKVREAITDKTRAIIPVHLYGNPCDMNAIMAIAEEFHLSVIEDATESLGATFAGKPTGSFGDFGCFSFNGNKLITTGGGGAVIGKDSEKLEHIRYLANQAKDKSLPGFHSEMGFNYRMTNVGAALGLAQMEKIERFLQKKKMFREIYQNILGELAEVRFQKEYNGAIGSGWFTCVTVDSDVQDLMSRLQEKNIPSRRVFIPLDEMPYLKQCSRQCQRAHEIYEKGLCLPGSILNEERDIEQVALMIREVLNG